MAQFGIAPGIPRCDEDGDDRENKEVIHIENVS